MFFGPASWVIALLTTGIPLVKEKIGNALQPTIPAENWANKELYHEDMMNGVSAEQLMKNVQNGKYRMTKTYPEPHRNEKGQIIIENCLLYNEDLKKYGAVQTMKWVNQGKYNLEGEALQKEQERIKRKYEHLYNLQK